MLIEHTENGRPRVRASSIRRADGKWRSFTIRRLESATIVSRDLRDNLTLPLLPYMKSACTIFSMKNFWNELNKPIFILAPMEDVTDTVLRQVIARCGKPAVFFTEFTNVEGMFSKGERLVTQRLRYTEAERPLVAQILGTRPQNFFKAAKKLIDMGFDCIDLNMGCPASGVMQKSACSGLMNNRPLSKEFFYSTKEGAAGLIPVSVNTRRGFRPIAFS